MANEKIITSEVLDNYGQKIKNYINNTYQTKGDYVLITDSRLSDARTPLEHTHSQSDITNLTTDLQNIREVAEGKTKTFVVNGEQTEENLELFINFEQSSYYSDDPEYLLPVYPEMLGSVQFENYVVFTDINDNEIKCKDLSTGDAILVAQTEVPDWWIYVDAVNHYVYFYKLETTKTDLTSYATKSDLIYYATKTELNTKEAKSNLKALAYKDSLTASEVGARPNTWMPTASDVGALPDTLAVVKSINGNAPDSNGNVQITLQNTTTFTVNGSAVNSIDFTLTDGVLNITTT